MIECDLLPIIKRYSRTVSKKPKHGMYCQSWFWAIKGYAKKKWVVLVNIDLDYEEAKKECEDDETIVKRCVEFLNTPPKSKYGKVRKRKALYGDFDPEPYSFQIKEDDKGKKYILAKLVTNQQKNKKFHGTGPSI
tara:strand:- start:1234 stop:1638 length:405 start_codon:yes stop_codon:yes gene_type:complete